MLWRWQRSGFHVASYQSALLRMGIPPGAPAVIRCTLSSQQDIWWKLSHVKFGEVKPAQMMVVYWGLNTNPLTNKRLQRQKGFQLSSWLDQELCAWWIPIALWFLTFDRWIWRSNDMPCTSLTFDSSSRTGQKLPRVEGVPLYQANRTLPDRPRNRFQQRGWNWNHQMGMDQDLYIRGDENPSASYSDVDHGALTGVDPYLDITVLYTYVKTYIHTSRRVVYRTRVFNVCSVRHWFHTTNHSGFASLSKFNFLKKYARTFHWICKKPQRHSFFLR